MPPEAKVVNNKVFADLFWKSFLDAAGAPDARLAKVEAVLAMPPPRAE